MIELTKSEEIVMKCIWEQPGLSVSTLLELIKERYNKVWKRTTVCTFLFHIANKGYVVSERRGRVFYYTPIIEEEDYQLYKTEWFLNFWFDGSIEKFMKALDHEDK